VRWVCPAAGTAERLGITQQAVVCGGVSVQPGDIVIGDRDGVVVVTEAELLALLPKAEEVQRTEAKVLAPLARSVSTRFSVFSSAHSPGFILAASWASAVFLRVVPGSPAIHTVPSPIFL